MHSCHRTSKDSRFNFVCFYYKVYSGELFLHHAQILCDVSLTVLAKSFITNVTLIDSLSPWRKIAQFLCIASIINTNLTSWGFSPHANIHLMQMHTHLLSAKKPRTTEVLDDAKTSSNKTNFWGQTSSKEWVIIFLPSGACIWFNESNCRTDYVPKWVLAYFYTY